MLRTENFGESKYWYPDLATKLELGEEDEELRLDAVVVRISVTCLHDLGK